MIAIVIHMKDGTTQRIEKAFVAIDATGKIAVPGELKIAHAIVWITWAEPGTWTKIEPIPLDTKSVN